MVIEQHEYLEEEGTKELIALTKAALNTKLDSDDATIDENGITINEHRLEPMTTSEVSTMWNNTTPT